MSLVVADAVSMQEVFQRVRRILFWCVGLGVLFLIAEGSNSLQGSPSAHSLSSQSNQNQAHPDNQEAAQEVLAPLTEGERALNLHELIANQPDFGADLEFFVAEHKIGGAYGFAYRLVRKGNRFREESKFWIFIGEVGQRTARLFPPSKSYNDMEPPRGESMNEGGLLESRISQLPEFALGCPYSCSGAT